jgi:hypothetical protein
VVRVVVVKRFIGRIILPCFELKQEKASHDTYCPTLQDVIRSSCFDLFLYRGNNMNLSSAAKDSLHKLMTNGERRRPDEAGDIRIPGVVWEIDEDVFTAHARHAAARQVQVFSRTIILIPDQGEGQITTTIVWRDGSKRFLRTLAAMEQLFLGVLAAQPG